MSEFQQYEHKFELWLTVNFLVVTFQVEKFHFDLFRSWKSFFDFENFSSSDQNNSAIFKSMGFLASFLLNVAEISLFWVEAN